MRLDVILRVTTKVILPFMLLFAVYVQFSRRLRAGRRLPGGRHRRRQHHPLRADLRPRARRRGWCRSPSSRLLIPLGVLIYAGVGVYAMLTGGNFLDYNHLAHDPVHGQEWGVFLVEIGVFITVSSTMLAIFYAFAGRGRG